LLLGCAPAKVGVKVTVRVHVVFAGSEGGQLLLCTKSLLIDMPFVELIRRGAVPVLAKVTI